MPSAMGGEGQLLGQGRAGESWGWPGDTGLARRRVEVTSTVGMALDMGGGEPLVVGGGARMESGFQLFTMRKDGGTIATTEMETIGLTSEGY